MASENNFKKTLEEFITSVDNFVSNVNALDVNSVSGLNDPNLQRLSGWATKLEHNLNDIERVTANKNVAERLTKLQKQATKLVGRLDKVKDFMINERSGQTQASIQNYGRTLNSVIKSSERLLSASEKEQKESEKNVVQLENEVQTLNSLVSMFEESKARTNNTKTFGDLQKIAKQMQKQRAQFEKQLKQIETTEKRMAAQIKKSKNVVVRTPVSSTQGARALETATVSRSVTPQLKPMSPAEQQRLRQIQNKGIKAFREGRVTQLATPLGMPRHLGYGKNYKVIGEARRAQLAFLDPLQIAAQDRKAELERLQAERLAEHERNRQIAEAQRQEKARQNTPEMRAWQKAQEGKILTEQEYKLIVKRIANHPEAMRSAPFYLRVKHKTPTKTFTNRQGQIETREAKEWTDTYIGSASVYAKALKPNERIVDTYTNLGEAIRYGNPWDFKNLYDQADDKTKRKMLEFLYDADEWRPSQEGIKRYKNRRTEGYHRSGYGYEALRKQYLPEAQKYADFVVGTGAGRIGEFKEREVLDQSLGYMSMLQKEERFSKEAERRVELKDRAIMSAEWNDLRRFIADVVSSYDSPSSNTSNKTQLQSIIHDFQNAKTDDQRREALDKIKGPWSGLRDRRQALISASAKDYNQEDKSDYETAEGIFRRKLTPDSEVIERVEDEIDGAVQKFLSKMAAEGAPRDMIESIRMSLTLDTKPNAVDEVQVVHRIARLYEAANYYETVLRPYYEQVNQQLPKEAHLSLQQFMSKFLTGPQLSEYNTSKAFHSYFNKHFANSFGAYKESYLLLPNFPEGAGHGKAYMVIRSDPGSGLTDKESGQFKTALGGLKSARVSLLHSGDGQWTDYKTFEDLPTLKDGDIVYNWNRDLIAMWSDGAFHYVQARDDNDKAFSPVHAVGAKYLWNSTTPRDNYSKFLSKLSKRGLTFLGSNAELENLEHQMRGTQGVFEPWLIDSLQEQIMGGRKTQFWNETGVNLDILSGLPIAPMLKEEGARRIVEEDIKALSGDTLRQKALNLTVKKNKQLAQFAKNIRGINFFTNAPQQDDALMNQYDALSEVKAALSHWDELLPFLDLSNVDSVDDLYQIFQNKQINLLLKPGISSNDMKDMGMPDIENLYNLNTNKTPQLVSRLYIRALESQLNQIGPETNILQQQNAAISQVAQKVEESLPKTITEDADVEKQLSEEKQEQLKADKEALETEKKVTIEKIQRADLAKEAADYLHYDASGVFTGYTSKVRKPRAPREAKPIDPITHELSENVENDILREVQGIHDDTNILAKGKGALAGGHYKDLRHTEEETQEEGRVEAPHLTQTPKEKIAEAMRLLSLEYKITKDISSLRRAGATDAMLEDLEAALDEENPFSIRSQRLLAERGMDPETHAAYTARKSDKEHSFGVSQSVAEVRDALAEQARERKAQRQDEKAYNDLLKERLGYQKKFINYQRELDVSGDPIHKQALRTTVGYYKGQIADVSERISNFGSGPNGTLTAAQKKKLDDSYVGALTEALVEGGAKQKGARNFWDKMVQDIGSSFRNMFNFSITARSAHAFVRDIQKVIQITKQLNEVMTNIRIVTGENETAATSLMHSYNALAKELGSTTAEVAASANEWLNLT